MRPPQLSLPWRSGAGRSEVQRGAVVRAGGGLLGRLGDRLVGVAAAASLGDSWSRFSTRRSAPGSLQRGARAAPASSRAQRRAFTCHRVAGPAALPRPVSCVMTAGAARRAGGLDVARLIPEGLGGQAVGDARLMAGGEQGVARGF